jgi:L-ascorbate metabolism protein UlaG (beta-lactamase superfamily)
MNLTSRDSITFLGHSSVLLSIEGTHILADPNFSRRIALVVRRRSRLPITIDDLPPIDAVLISHGHLDHLDVPTLRRLPRTATVVVPPGLQRLVERAGMKRVVTLSPWQEYRVKNLTVTAVPAKHFGGRSPLHTEAKYQGYVIEGSTVIYFAGDTGLFEGLADIGAKWDIGAALLPIGAYEPPPFRRNHMSPEDAVQAALLLRARLVVPIHWGTFKLSLEPFDEPAPRLLKAAADAGIEDIVHVLKPGETISVNGRIK